MYLIGCDIGSSSVKCALVEAESGSVIDLVHFPESGEMEIVAARAGWAEQDPGVWWENLCLCIGRLISKHKIAPASIKAVGIAYQMHGLVLVDKNQQLVRPAIIWCDSRAVATGQRAFEEMGPDFCLENFLNSPGNFTASKLKWVMENEPEIYSQADKMLLPGDYIAMRLTGNISTSLGGLSEAMLWNFKEHKVASSLLSHYGIAADMLPTQLGALELLGEITSEAAEQTGLATGTPVTYRAGDQPNNAAALNVLNNGEIAGTCGTSGVIYGVVDRPCFDPQSRINAFAHVNHTAENNRIGVLLCINGAGIAHSWMKQAFSGGSTYDEMEASASTVPVGAEGLCLLPFGNGAERIFNNRDLGSHLHNLQYNRHNNAHLCRATLEGIAFAFVYGASIFQEMGIEIDVIRVGNDNLFQSTIFSNTIATLLGTSIEVVDTAGAIGAARSAGVGANFYTDLAEANEAIKPLKVYEALEAGAYVDAYNKWLDALRQIDNKL